MIGPTKRIRLDNIQVYMDQLAAHLPQLHGENDEIGQLWQTLNEEVNKLSVDIQQQDGVLRTTTAIAEATDTIARLGELLPTLIKMIRKHLYLDQVALYLLDESGEWLEHRAGLTGFPSETQDNRVKVDTTTSFGRAIEQQQPAYISATDDEQGVVLPLISRGEVLGALVIGYQAANNYPFHPDNLTALQTLATQVANAIQSIQLFATIDEQLEQMATLYHISLQVGSHLNINLQLNNYTLDFDALLDNLAQLSLQLTGAEASGPGPRPRRP
jgi:GAF domain-containing protein